jgi:uncharacterized protein YjbI with pentapeptide repeats
VRIGAILSLERIAQDSTAYDKGRDHVRVMEILCAYVRENSNARKPVDFPEEEWKPLKPRSDEATRVAHLKKFKERFGGAFAFSKAWKWAQTLSAPRADIAMALAVLGRRTIDQRAVEAAWPNPPADTTVWPFEGPWPKLPEKEPDEATTETEIAQLQAELVLFKRNLASYRGYRLDLRGSNLQGADMSRTILSAADLAEARLEGTKFIGAQLVGTRLGKVTAEGASFHKARMQGASLFHARMEGTNLSETWMEGANLGSARLEGSFFGRARMGGAILNNAIMEATQLNGARIEGADFFSARMAGAILNSARLEGSSLCGTGMEGSELHGTRLTRADLSLARIEGAEFSYLEMDAQTNLTNAGMRRASVRFVDYTDVKLSQEQADQMFGDGSVKLPEGLTRPAHWPEWELGRDDFPEEWEKWQTDPEGYRPPPAPEAG